MKKYLFIPVVLLLLALGACSEDEETTKPSLKITGSDGTEVALNGTWERCLVETMDDGSQEAWKESVTLNGESMTFSNLFYLSSVCSGIAIFDFKGSATITLLDTTVEAELKGQTVTANKADLDFTAASILPYFKDAADYLNGLGEDPALCGITEYSANKETSLPLDCDELGFSDMEKGLIYVDNSGASAVMFQSDGSPTSPKDDSGYPLALDGDGYTKQ